MQAPTARPALCACVGVRKRNDENDEFRPEHVACAVAGRKNEYFVLLGPSARKPNKRNSRSDRPLGDFLRFYL